MKLVIPFNPDPGTVLEIDVVYDVVATGGPPEPPFDIRLIGGTFIEHWRVVEGVFGTVDVVAVFDDYIDPSSAEVKTPYDEYIAKYLDNYKEAVRLRLREFELTKPESVV